MMLRILLALMAFPFALLGQNLVQNPSFEQIASCITSEMVSHEQNIPSMRLAGPYYWNAFSREGSADLYHPCSISDWAPREHGMAARSGRAYAGLYVYDGLVEDYREYVLGKLKQPLQAGKSYRVSFFCAIGHDSRYSSSALGVYFSADSLYYPDYREFYEPAPFIPQVQNKKRLDRKGEWMEVTGTFKAKGGEQYLMLGNFLPDAQTDTLALPTEGKFRPGKRSYYYIDDVCVLPADDNNCGVFATSASYRIKLFSYNASNKQPISCQATILSPELLVLGSGKGNEEGMATLPAAKGDVWVKADKEDYFPSIRMATLYADKSKNGLSVMEQMEYAPMVQMVPGAKQAFGDCLNKKLAELPENDRRQISLCMEAMGEKCRKDKRLAIKITLSYYPKAGSQATQHAADMNDNLEQLKAMLLAAGAQPEQVALQLKEVAKDDVQMRTPAGYKSACYLLWEVASLGEASAATAEAARQAAVQIKVMDEGNNEPVRTSVRVIKITGEEVANGKTDRNGAVSLSFPEGTYNLSVEEEGYFPLLQPIEAKGLSEATLKVRKPAVGQPWELSELHFDPNKYELKPESLPQLKMLQRFLEGNPKLKIQINGHTDSGGNSEENQLLSEQRAKAVIIYLVSQGVDVSRLSFKGFGNTKPVASNDTLEGKALNRRVEIEVLE